MDADTQHQEPSASKPWLDAIEEAEKAFNVWNEKCDRIDELYANLSKMADARGDRQFQIFWSNVEIMRPSVYQRAPQPVVMPRHSDTGEIPRKASELVERALEYDVEADDLHETLLLVRDDLCLSGRGVPWVLDDARCIHVDRRDFLHEPARKWKEVSWVARRAYVGRDEGVKRFGETFLDAKREEIGNDRGDDYQSTGRKAQVWEIWSKTSGTVVWVTEGVDTVLDEQPPLFDVKGFFPCPKPAYATVERGTLKPIPDFVYYRDQVDEINELTARISGLAESLRLKGFIAAGASEVADAVETAMKQTDNKAILIPVSSAAAMGGKALRDAIVWLPVSEVAGVIQACIELRKQLIDDVYEITGLSDIMRGVTQAQETLGAQNLKAQFGSVRVREKQSEMVRVALDVLRIKAEIMAEKFGIGELMQMAGMQLPTALQVEQMMAQAQQSGQQLPQTVTVEQVAALLTDQRTRPFAMEVETDSTIAPNEAAEKQSRTEFLTAVGGFISQAAPLIQSQPEAAPFMGEMLRFGAGAFRAGRDLGGEIDQFVETVKQKAAQGQGQQPSPEQIKAQGEAQKLQADMQVKQTELALKERELALKESEVSAKLEAGRYQVDLNAALKAQDQRIKLQELGVKQDEQRLKEAQAEIDAMMQVAEVELERDQQRPVGIGDN
ncbi:hypothetical protein J7363_04725 [Phaeobacter italicus]|uniref:hypothetical protein n=1 Tax=Phaeobacter italicus TaxID=481446 RepID=UPI001ADA8A25|nr:hypothetical protein [Phaeobacter italicus]MBO9441385.1 hypothetical protein [Phaeobacter italicus]